MIVQPIDFETNDFTDMEKYKRAQEIQEIVDFILGMNKKNQSTFMAHFCAFARESSNMNKAETFLVYDINQLGNSEKHLKFKSLLNNLVEAAKQQKYDQNINVEDNLKNLRGSICELLIEKCLLCRYAREEVHCNSIVLFDGIHYTHNDKYSPSTLDNIGWNNSLYSGEFYECKTKVKYLVEKRTNKFRFLVSLRKELIRRGINAVVAVASLDNDYKYKKTLNQNHIIYIPFMKLLDVKSNCPA